MIEAPREHVFDVMADPQKGAVAAGSPVPKKVQRTPNGEGTSWAVRHGLWSKTQYTVTEYARPKALTKRLTGSIRAVVEDHFESVGSSTKVLRRFAVSRVPLPFSITDYRQAQEQFLVKIKAYVESQGSASLRPPG
jgi:hypothetical protein